MKRCGVMHAAEPVENHIELPAYSLTPASPEWSRMSYVEQLAACNLSEEQTKDVDASLFAVCFS